MTRILIWIKRVLGLDASIGFTVLSKLVQLLGGFISFLFIAKYLTDVQQGYYFTFGSILAIQVFFELGLSGIIVQFVAHENAILQETQGFSDEEKDKSWSRLSSLLRFTIKWFGIAAMVLFVGLVIFGLFFFNRYGKGNAVVDWVVPWMVLSATTSLALLLSPILAFFEGMGMVRDVAKARFLQQLLQYSVLLVLLAGGFQLLASPIAALVSLALLFLLILSKTNLGLLRKIWKSVGQWKVNYKKEIFPVQWKIAVSWISGYFIFQLFNPILFATEGSVVAGQMGMTLAIVNAIAAFSFSWMSTKTPVFSGYIAKKDFFQLDYLFSKTLVQSSILSFAGVVVFMLFIVLSRQYDVVVGDVYIGNRFLPYLPLVFMCLTVLFNHISGSWALYLRCHKREPLLLQSITLGLLCSASALILGKNYGVVGLTSGYLVLTVVSFGWIFLTWQVKRKEWHFE
jgi:O-antigen/teichoic acid export membrane protein